MMDPVGIKGVAAAGLLVTGLALGGWVIFLTTQGLDRADMWSSVVGAIAATVLGLAGVAIGLMSLRATRAPDHRAAAADPAAADPGAADPGAADPGAADLAAGPGAADSPASIQWNIASGGGTVFGVQGGDLHVHQRNGE